MREFVISGMVLVAVGLAWLTMWAVALRAFGLPVFARTPEELSIKRERIVRLGKRRYILIFGVAGFGFAMGLAITLAEAVAHPPVRWWDTAAHVIFLAVLGGWWYGARTWNDSFRGEVPFPPPFPPHN